MTDAIFGDRFLGRAPAWHGLGTVIDPSTPLSVMDAMVMAKANYRVALEPVTVTAFGQTLETGKLAIVREPIEDDPQLRLFGFAGENYQVIQNFEFGQMVGDLSEREGWPIETVGVLGKGETFFLTLKASSVEIEGDGEVDIYFLVSDGKDGGTATRIATTPVRVVCQNTLIMGLKAATLDASVIHRGDVHGEVAWNMDVVAQMKKAQDAVTAAMRIMAKPETRLDPDEIEQVFEAAYPSVLPDTKAVARARTLLDGTITLDEARAKGLQIKVSKRDAWLETVREYRGAARARFVIFNDEFPQVAETPWAVYNAIAETEQYRKGRSDSTISRDMLFGGYRGKAVEAAFNVAFSLASRKS